MNESKKRALNIELSNKARTELIELDNQVQEFYKDKSVILIPQVERAFNERSSRINKTLDLRRKIEEIYTPEQELQIQILKVNLDLKKSELIAKNKDIELKDIDLKLSQKKAEYYLK